MKTVIGSMVVGSIMAFAVACSRGGETGSADQNIESGRPTTSAVCTGPGNGVARPISCTISVGEKTATLQPKGDDLAAQIEGFDVLVSDASNPTDLGIPGPNGFPRFLATLDKTGGAPILRASGTADGLSTNGGRVFHYMNHDRTDEVILTCTAMPSATPANPNPEACPGPGNGVARPISCTISVGEKTAALQPKGDDLAAQLEGLDVQISDASNPTDLGIPGPNGFPRFLATLDKTGGAPIFRVSGTAEGLSTNGGQVFHYMNHDRTDEVILTCTAK